MKIALAQLNYHIGNFEQNTDKIISTIEKAKKNNTDLIVFSELSVCGYPPLDLLERECFVNKASKAMNRIAEHCKGIATIIGTPSINKSKGKRLFNSAVFIENGLVKQTINKTLLPDYDIFDEYRYFEPNKDFNIIEFKGRKIALTICEDLWQEQPTSNSFAQSEIYSLLPMEELQKLNPDIMINIAASPFSTSHDKERTEVLSLCCKKYNLPLIYVNQVGAHTDLVFDGNSKVLNTKGELIKRLKEFEEDIDYILIDEIAKTPPIPVDDDYYISKIHKSLVLGIKDYFNKTGFTKATLGLSGGIDSAVVAALAVETLGSKNIRTLLLPSKFSSDHSISDAVALAKNLNIQHDIVPIEDIYNSFENSLENIYKGTEFNVAEENIQARIRGTLLMGISNKFGHILLNTTNKSEAAVGYGTLYGDMNGGLSILGDVYKTDVFKLAKYINRDIEIIPVNTITKPPSAELRPDQKDEDSLPPYEILDKVLKLYIEQNHSADDIIKLGIDPLVVNRIIWLVNCNEYKRYQMAPVIRVCSKAFGYGRKIPLVAKY